MTFGELLKLFREANGLTQEALAEQAGLSVRAVSALERGVNRTPRRDTLERLASALTLPARKRAQLIAAAYPSANSARIVNASVGSSQWLPVPATPLLGRDREVDAVVALLRRPEVRLVTLTGPGGVGKTRLAVQVVEDVGQAFDDGLCFVELAELRNPDDLATVIARSLSLHEGGGQSAIDRLLSHLAGKNLLLTLDNFEHLAAAAPVLARLLAAAAHLKVLVTSRVRLRVRAEHEFVVPPLELPDPRRRRSTEPAEHVLGFPATDLFAQRARAAGSAFDLTPASVRAVAEICRRLDGLPLAIELAAAKAKLLPPSALLQRLEQRLPLLTDGAADLPERQRTMRTAIAWSYDLLGSAEQAAFRHLAVCVGGCTLEAAQAVIGGDGSSNALLERLATLVDHSLIGVREDARGEPRISQLEVIREYALERLTEVGDLDQARARHAEHCLHLAEAASAHLIGSPDQAAWLLRLEQERGNMLAALEWAREKGAHQIGMRLVAALGPFWYFRGYLTEGRRWIETFLAATESTEHGHPSRIWLLYGLGKLATEQRDFTRVNEVARAALALAEHLGHALGVSQALELQGNAARLQGDALGGRAVLERSLLWARRSGERGQIERVLFGLAHAAREAGDLTGAQHAFEQLLDAGRDDGPGHGTARVLLSLGEIARDRLDDSRAETRYRESVHEFAQLGDPAGLAACFEGLATLARRNGDLAGTVRLAGIASGLRDSIGAGSAAAEPRIALDLAAARAALGEAAFAAEWRHGTSLSVEDAVASVV